MRILFTSTRGAGHLQPLLPYLHALQRHGQEVRVAAPESVSETLQNEKLRHAPFDHPGDEQLGVIWARLRGLPNDDANVLTIREIFAGLNARTALPGLRQTIRQWQPDLIVRESAEFAAAVAAEHAGIPHARVAVHNGHIEEGIISIAVDAVDLLRQEAGLSPDNGRSLRLEPVYTAFPASLDGGAVQGGEQSPFRVRTAGNITGSVTAPPVWAPKDGEQLLYITFGTIAAGKSETHAVYRAALEAVEALPVRALLTTGPGMEAKALGAIPDNVTIEPWVPQDHVWPHIKAIVCHGGSGTILGGLSAGVPMVVAPLFADQPDNARRIEEAGAGIAVFEPDAFSLRTAIERVLVDTEIHTNACRVAKEIRAMSSVDEAATALLAPLSDADTPEYP